MNLQSLALATMLAFVPASAGTISFNLTNPSGDVGSYTHTYSSSPSGYSITAYGYANEQTNHLYGKNGGGDEYGLGLVGTTDFEIGSSDIVVLDISQIAGFQSLELEIGSVQQGENYDILGGNSITNLSALLIAGGASDNTYFSVPHFSNYKYIGVTAPSGDVLINSIRATSAVPEPATFGLAGAVLGAIFLTRRRLMASFRS